MASASAGPTGSHDAFGQASSIVIETYDRYPPLANIRQGAQTVLELLRSVGFEDASPPVSGSMTFGNVLSGLARWPAHGERLLLYWAGHAEAVDGGGIYLLCRDTDAQAFAASAISGRALGELLAAKDFTEIVLIVDACHGGGGAQEITAAFRRMVETRSYPNVLRRSLAVISSAGRYQQSREHVFASALVEVLTEGPPASGVWLGWTDKDSHLTPGELVQALRLKLADTRAGQLPEHDMCGTIGRFFPNPRYSPHAADRVPDGPDWTGEADSAGLTNLRGPDMNEFAPSRFFGRRIPLRTINDWFRAPPGRPGPLVVTGPPGCGKSALMRELTAQLAGPHGNDRSGGVSVASGAETVAVSVSLSRKTLEDCVGELNRAFGSTEASQDQPGPRELVQGIHEAAGITILLFDALDEADQGDLQEIITYLLKPLASDQRTKVIIGTRTHYARTGGEDAADSSVLDRLEPGEVIRLDEDPDADGAIEEYVLHHLRAATGSAYRDDSYARRMAQLVVARSSGNFLLARMSVRALLRHPAPLSPAAREVDSVISRDLVEAFNVELARYGDEQARVRTFLAPLAWAEGTGLPRRDVWLAAANALARARPGEPPSYGDQDLAWVVGSAGSYLVESGEDGQTTYRLFHQAFADYFRADLQPREAQSAMVAALVGLIPARGSWRFANPYIRRHLATHSSEAGSLAEMLWNPNFVVHAEQYRLAKVIGRIDLRQHRLAQIWCLANDRMDGASPDRRAALLQAAALLNEPGVLDLLDNSVDLPWRGRWSVPVRPRTASPRENAADRPGVALAFGTMADRAFLASADDSTVHLWDLTTGQPAGELTGHHGAVRALATADIGGRPHLASAGDDSAIRLWDLTTGQPAGELTGHVSYVRALASGLSAEHAVLASAGDDGTIRVWDVASGTQVHVLAQPGRATSVAVSAFFDGSFVAAGTDDGRVRLWDCADGRLIRGAWQGFFDRSASTGWVVSIAVGQGGPWPLLATGNDDGVIRLWNAGSGEYLHSISAHSGWVRAVALARIDGRELLASGGDDGIVRLWDPLAGAQIRQLSGHQGWVYSVSFGRLGSRDVLATAGEDAIIRLWDVRSGAPVSTLVGHGGWIRSVTFATIADQVVIASASDDGTARIWDPVTGQEIRQITGHEGWIVSVTLASVVGQDLLATSGDDSTLRIWDARTGASLRTLTHGAWVSAVSFGTADGVPVLASGSDDCTACVWDPRTGERLAKFAQPYWVSCIALADLESGPALFTGGDQFEVRSWNVRHGGLSEVIEAPSRSPHAVALHSQGGAAYLATADDRLMQVIEIMETPA
jgi:WD40 repeat protein